ncbi:T9SS type A sorting domain-containing protein [Spirosoma foliorum]|uniref:T9SS type A sorting domain-containing protein n=1 Tax=Spirosoma foliorum TaxID=2710596 RepID=A0A7G5GXJ1_9BACT|nr:T9SS type A sorting domain-containing protein [Spirosoma foliorum]QMW03583.1 T9SS type A sorting domain-containing protein [Spirosoma foliorum]
MKTLIKPLFVAFALVLSTSYASLAKPTNDPQPATFQSGIFTNKAGKLQVALDKQTGQPLQIRLTSADGRMVFSQRVSKKQTTVRLVFDVSELPDGAYQLTITDGKETNQHTVTLETQKPMDVNRLVAIN